MRLRRAVLAVALCGLFGCARPFGRSYYQLEKTGSTDLLIPPGRSGPVKLRLPQARISDACTVSGNVPLAWKGRTAVIRLPARPSPAEIEALREGLLQLEQQRCLRPGGAFRLLTQAVERAELSSRTAFAALHGDYNHTGYMDIVPRFRLKLVAPVRRPGATGELKFQVESNPAARTVTLHAPPDLIGYETVVYNVVPDPIRPGVHLAVAEAELNRLGQVAREPSPTRDYLPLPPDARYFRMLFLTRSVRRDYNIIVLGATTPLVLAEATRAFDGNPNSDCRSLARPGLTCLELPGNTALNVEIPATANGERYYLPLGATVGELLRAAGYRSDRPPARLQVRRPYQGLLVPVRFNRFERDILSMTLLGGEQLTW